MRCICEEIERAKNAGDGRKQVSGTGTGTGTETPTGGVEAGESLVGQSDIVSLAEAKKRTGFLEHLIHDVKKFVWA